MKDRRARRRWWLDLPIRYKGLLVVALPLLAWIATIFIRAPFNRQQEETTAVLARAAETRSAADELLISMLDVDSSSRGYVLSGDPTYLSRIENARKSLPERLMRLASLLSTLEDERIYEQAVALVQRELTLASDVVALANSGAQPDGILVQQRLAQEKQATDALRAVIDTIRRSHEALVSESQAELTEQQQRLAPLLMVTFVGGLTGALTAGWLFATGIATRLSALERNAERLARGERLRFEPARGLDEIGSLDKTLRRASLLLRTRERELRTVNAELQRTVHEQVLLNRELEAFSYSVSHDLRAPLRSIDGFAQALREDWGDRLDEAGQDHLSRVRNAAQRMGRLIDDLLKLAKLTRAQVQRSDVDLSRIAQEICAELTERNPSRDVTWVIATDLHAQCDASLARVLLENLLGNAWKFTSKTPAARIEFVATPETQPPLFVVRDNGAGFDMKYVDKLFSPFQRLHGEREFPGIGIGLATVQRIVSKHGGDVRTRAEVGQGAAFYFTLAPSSGTAAA